MKKVNYIKNNVTVTLEQIAENDSHGIVYLLKSTVNETGWGYFRGDTDCIESLNGVRCFSILAEKFLNHK